MSATNTFGGAKMKWYAISGSWRLESPKLKEDLINAIDKIIKAGDGIVSGGALGVDYLATKRMFAAPNWQQRIKIIIPSSLETYAKHYFKRAEQGVITRDQAELLVEQLTKVKNAGALIEMDFDELNQETYYARNTEVVKNADEVWAFQINNSGGVSDTVEKATKLGKKVVWKKYQVEAENA